MSSALRFRELDTRAWSTATWATPFMTQLVLGTLIVIAWLLGKRLDYIHGAVLFLISAVTTSLICLAAMGVLLASRSQRARGLGISIAGSCVMVLVGGSIYGVWIIQW